MNAQIRQEKAADHAAVEQLIAAAFKNVVESDQREHLLVARLRKTDAFIPELSLVAEVDGTLVGHILLSRIRINNTITSYPSLALAPVSVHPDFQRQGIGGQLIREAHQIAKALGHSSIVLVGHPDYYPRFGYEPCSKFGIKMPFPAPEEACMLKVLKSGDFERVNGLVEYHPTFFE